MSSAKQEVRSLLQKLSNDCTLEDIQYHLYVIEKINRGLHRAKKEGTVSHWIAENRLRKWVYQRDQKIIWFRCTAWAGLPREKIRESPARWNYQDKLED